MISSFPTASNESRKSNHGLKKAAKTDRGLKVDLRVAYNAGNGVQNTGAGDTDTGDKILGTPSLVPTSIKFTDLPVPIRHTRAPPRPVTPYPPSMETVPNTEYSDNATEAAAAVLCSPRPKNGFQPMTL